MTWTYTGNPVGVTLDQVRLLIRDTNINNPLLQDEELNWFIAEEPNVYYAAAMAAEAIAAKFGTLLSSKSVGDLSITYANKQEEYKKIASALRDRGFLKMGVKPYAGGIRKSDKETTEADQDRVEPSFKRGMHDFEDTEPSQ